LDSLENSILSTSQGGVMPRATANNDSVFIKR
jgi:hypothetical protein